MNLQPEGWDTPQKILVVLAHPDDPEFFCGATLARWTKNGHEVVYCLLTRGDKGGKDLETDPVELGKLREVEQNAAARIIGASKVRFLDYSDGTLIPSLEARKEVVRVIRQEKPDILMSCDPTNYFPTEVSINHPDHRNAGQIAVDASFPAAGNALFYPELIREEGLEPHSLREVWLSVTHQPNTVIDISDTWEIKLQALHEHRSQIGEVSAFDQRMRSRHTPDSTPETPRYEEKFRRIRFK